VASGENLVAPVGSVTLPRSIVLSARVLRTTSPRGVAPPVSDDCAPTGSTFVAAATSALTSSMVWGNATPAA
jgi:hypothetical protein